MQAQPAQRDAGTGDLNALIPAFLAADAEQRQAALAVLLGHRDQDDLAIPSQGEERFLNQQELGNVLGVHTTTIRRWDIPCHRLGRVPRYLMAEVRDYLDSRQFKRRLATLQSEREKRQRRQP